jgi:tetratricopeptide (TPR) repeat protein
VQAGSIQHLSLIAPGVSAMPVVPRQLPLAVLDFTGRAEQLAYLDGLLDHEPYPPGDAGAGTVVISAVDGAGGVGKTTLAVHWGRRVEHRFPDGTLFANLRGYGPGIPLGPGEVLAGFLLALGIPAEAIPVGVEAQSGLYRSVLAGRRVLIVLDNANATSQVWPLLPGSPGCLVVVTSRASLTGLVVEASARRLPLDLMSPAEALDLLRALLGPERVAAESGQVAELIRLCARLPLALRIAAARVAANPYLSVADLVGDLGDDRARLDLLSMSDDDQSTVRAVFDGSYRRLPSEQSRLFRLLGLHPGYDIDAHAAAALAEVDLSVARRLLGALADAHLVEPVGRDRYRLHDLLRAYAADRADHEDDQVLREQASRRLIEWYAHHAATAMLMTHPAHTSEPYFNTPTCGRPEIIFSRLGDVIAWWDAELSNLAAITRWTATSFELPQLASLLQHTVGQAGYRRGRWAEALAACESGLAMARRAGDRAQEADALLYLAEMLSIAPDQRWEDVDATAQEALVLARHAADQRIETYALNNLAVLRLDQQRYGEAVEYLQRALPLSAGWQHGRLVGVIEGNLSQAHTGLGNYDLAVEHAHREQLLRQKAGDVTGALAAPLHLAMARQGQGRHDEVIVICEQALADLDEQNHVPADIAKFLTAFGVSLRAVGDLVRATEYWQRALAVYEVFDLQKAAEVRGYLNEMERSAEVAGEVVLEVEAVEVVPVDRPRHQAS